MEFFLWFLVPIIIGLLIYITIFMAEYFFNQGYKANREIFARDCRAIDAKDQEIDKLQKELLEAKEIIKSITLICCKLIDK